MNLIGQARIVIGATNDSCWTVIGGVLKTHNVRLKKIKKGSHSPGVADPRARIQVFQEPKRPLAFARCEHEYTHFRLLMRFSTA